MAWTIHGDGKSVEPGAVVRPGERLSWPRTIGLGGQHVVAMFGATFLVPIITGFDPSTTLLFSGLGTLLFLLLTGNRMPSYLGSSFAFISPVIAAKSGGDISTALFAIAATGVALALVGLLVMKVGTGWIHALMPPVVMGGVVALIGFNLAQASWNNVINLDAGGSFAPGGKPVDGDHLLLAAVTVLSIVVIAALFRGILGRIAVLLGFVVAYLVAVVMGVVSFDAVKAADWVGLPELTSPSVEWSVLPMFLPVVFVLVAENVGHVRSVAHLVQDDSLNDLTGRALLADGLATTVAGLGGGSATTTYGENIGVMSATRVFSTAAYWVAGVVAILLSLSPKFGALLFTIPNGVIGGATLVLYGVIGLIGVRMWIDRQVDFGQQKNLFPVAAALILAMGMGNDVIAFGDFTLGGIAIATAAILVLYHLMNALERVRDGRATADAG
ncbi:NCS2 family nucleobase:cation symporter [Nocardioides sp. zg-ZUI104]|uniref:uracil-xanthine permease family protein n=1 Tax=Nocardioides faecalis TaxID=2803858 RepID=UPI001BD0EFA0|nr:solute carrier family 23 protein [Nocardioides faecalis]MBS4752181.1 NCS2 family nucleobase:cation symporter [Nocardioides faecalis]